MSTTDKMSENHRNYRDRLEEIRADWTRSDEAKRQDLHHEQRWRQFAYSTASGEDSADGAEE